MKHQQCHRSMHRDRVCGMGRSLPDRVAWRAMRAMLGMLGLLVVSTACTKLDEFDRGQLDAALKDSLLQATESWDPDLTLMEDDRVKLRIRGSHATHWQLQDRKQTQLKGPVTIELYDLEGGIATQAVALSAVFTASTGTFELMDSVNVTSHSDDGERYLRGDYLIWSSDEDRISSDRMVTIVTPTDSITGTQFESTIDLKTYTIVSPRGRSEVD
jgi:LPS export ABC transporter protein LptC